MNNNASPHVPFDQLPIEACVLFSIVAAGAVARFSDYPPSQRALALHLGTIWDTNKLALRDLRDWDRMIALLEAHSAELLEQPCAFTSNSHRPARRKERSESSENEDVHD